MVSVSIHPYQPRKILLLAAALTCFALFPCFADPVLLSVPSTPYDHQMSRIRYLVSYDICNPK